MRDRSLSLSLLAFFVSWTILVVTVLNIRMKKKKTIPASIDRINTLFYCSKMNFLSLSYNKVTYNFITAKMTSEVCECVRVMQSRGSCGWELMHRREEGVNGWASCMTMNMHLSACVGICVFHIFSDSHLSRFHFQPTRMEHITFWKTKDLTCITDYIFFLILKN